jgi:hypothetical protein
VVHNWLDIAWIIIYNLVTYLTFPLAEDLIRFNSTFYKIGGAATAAILIILLSVAIVRAKVKFSWNFLDTVVGPVKVLSHSWIKKKAP